MPSTFRKYTAPPVFKLRVYRPKGIKFNIKSLRKFAERSEHIQQQWSAPRTILGMSIPSTYAFLLYAADYFSCLARYGLPRTPRSVWCLQRGTDLYRDMENIWTTYPPTIENQKYRQKFRMEKETFDGLANELLDEPEFCKMSTPLRDAIPPRKRLAITLHWLAKAPMFDELADLYGVGKSTAIGIVHQCMEAIDRVLTPVSIKFPTTCMLLWCSRN